MFKSFLKSALRNLVRDGFVTGANVFGLSASFTITLIVFLYVQRELDYDNLDVADRLFRVEFQQKSDQSPKWPVVPHDWVRKYAPKLPGVINSTQIRRSSTMSKIEVGASTFLEKDVIISSPGIIDMFDLELKGSTLSEPLEGRKKVLLSQSLASRYFKEQDPVGEMITVNGEDGFLVTGVFERTVPLHMEFEMILSVDKTITRGPFYWLFTYIELQEGVQADLLEDRTNTIADEWEDSFFNDAEYRMVPMPDIYFGANAELQVLKYGDLNSIYIFLAIGMMILLTASLNFFNLTVASLEKRAKEVGIRKVLGSTQSQVIGRLLNETLVVVIVACIVGTVLVNLSLPFVNRDFDLALELSGVSFTPAAGLLLLFVLVAVFASLYASFFPYVTARRLSKKACTPWYKRICILFQFGISMLLIIGVLVVSDQLKFMKERDLGFGNDPVLMIKMLDPQLNSKIKEYAKRFEAHPAILSASAIMGSPGNPQLVGNQNAWAEGMPTGESIFLPFYAGDEKVIETLGLNLIEGQDFSSGVNVPAGTLATIVNESAVRQFGWQNAVGKRMAISGTPAIVLGVVKDFHFMSLQNSITPTAIVFDYNLYLIGLRVRADGVDAAMDFVKEQWEIIAPDNAMEAFFLQESFNAQYAHEQKLSAVLEVLTVVALLISAVGTLGMMMLMIRLRTREIGIRKVLGASLGQIVLLLNRQIFLLLLLGVLIVWPLAYYLADQWLNTFAYRIELRFSSFLLAALVTAMVSFCTYGYHMVRAASRNPVDVLRNE